MNCRGAFALLLAGASTPISFLEPQQKAATPAVLHCSSFSVSWFVDPPFSPAGMAIILFTVSALLLWLSKPLWQLAANYKIAASSGLPFIVCPVDPDNIVWRLSSVYLRTTFDKWLPNAVNQRLKLATFGWEFHVKWAIHGRLGSIFILVTPGLNQVWIADPEAAIDVLARRNDFVKQPAAKQMLSFMGPNVVSVSEPF